jgi:hypothetical protein
VLREREEFSGRKPYVAYLMEELLKEKSLA